MSVLPFYIFDNININRDLILNKQLSIIDVNLINKYEELFFVLINIIRTIILLNTFYIT